MNDVMLLFLILAFCVILGVILGLLNIRNTIRNMPEFFAAKLFDEEPDFLEISRNLKVVNQIEDLSIYRFIIINRRNIW